MSSRTKVLKPIITNICAKAKLSCLIDLNYIFKSENHLNFINKRYNPKKFVGLIVKIQSTNGTVLIFNSGSLILMGCKTIDDLFLTCNDIIKELRHIGYNNITIYNLKVTNYCAAMNLNERINLEKIANCYPKESSLEMEIFPGLKLTMNNIKYTIHYNGKFFGTGFKSIRQINKKFTKMKDFLLNYQK